MMRKGDRETRIAPRDYWTPSAIFEEMERLLDDFRAGIMDFWTPAVAMGPRIPAVDIRDTGNEYVIEAELPGMKKEDVEIEIIDGGLKISASKKEEKEEKGEGYLRRERGYLSFSRQLPLPEDADVDRTEARLTDGVLQINVPKIAKAEQKKRLVEVK